MRQRVGQAQRVAKPRNHNRDIGAPSRSGRLAVVDSSHLNPWQAKLMCAALRPTLGYLYRLRDRMEKRRFPPTDKLLCLTTAAYKALHALTIELHYLSCGGAVYREPAPSG